MDAEAGQAALCPQLRLCPAEGWLQHEAKNCTGMWRRADFTKWKRQTSGERLDLKPSRFALCKGLTESLYLLKKGVCDWGSGSHLISGIQGILSWQ